MLYHQALTNDPKYKFVTQALTRHDQNLRLNVVEGIIARIDLSDLKHWLGNSPNITDLFVDKQSILEQLEAEIIGFVQLRNDAAHGNFSELVGKEILNRYCSLIKELVKALSGYFHKHLLSKRVNAKKSIRIGRVSEVFIKAGAFIIDLDYKSSLTIGSHIHLVNSNYCTSQNIINLQLNNADILGITNIDNKMQIGVKCTINPKKNTEVFVDIP